MCLSKHYTSAHAYVSASVKIIVQLIDIVLWLRDDHCNKDKMCFCFYFYYSMSGLLIQSSPVRGIIIFFNRLKDQVCVVKLGHLFSFNMSAPATEKFLEKAH